MADTLKLTSIKDGAPARAERSTAPLGVALAVCGAALAAWSVALAVDAGAGAGDFLRSGLIAAWVAAAVLVALARPDEPLGLVVAWGAVSGGVGAAAASLLADEPASGIARVALAARPAALMLVVAAGLHLVCALPDGRLRNAGRRALVLGGYAAAIATAVVLWAKRPSLPIWPAVAGAALVVLVGGGVSAARYRRVKALDRKRMQWFGWGITIAGGIAVLTAATHLLVKWPGASALPDVAGGATIFVPLGLALGSWKGGSRHIDRILTHTIALAGLSGLVVVVYFVIVLGLGRVPTARERSVLLLSMVAAGVAALLYLPTRDRLTAFATRIVYGERHAPDEAIRTFSQRLSRAVPLDELLLQMAESLRKTLALHAAEVWTGSAGAFERAVASPERPNAEISLGPAEEPVVARSGVSGPAWMKVWVPALLAGREGAILRVAPVTHSGELLGLIVVERREGAEPFNADEELILAELARQVGLALYNVKLDSALQASLDEVRRQAEELRASRARIVATADAERRRIERNLHDGAQQHLVALAVKVRLIKQLADADPAQAKQMLEELGGDVQATLEELRTLAHGIYPPLLMDRGLAEALSAAATRAALPVEVRADGVGRFRPEVEAAVYFCCLEALQNAAKHAGEGARAVVRVWLESGALLFEVADDGAGFDAADPRIGAGFTNMRDRLGAIGGALIVDSRPGEGARIGGRIPVAG